MIDFDTAVALINDHDSWRSLSRSVDGADGGAGETTYRKLAKLIHPDAAGPQRRVTATEAFAKLSRLYARREALSGDIADLTRTGGTLLKVPREPRDNDLMEAEAAALRQLWQKGDPKYRPYAPKLIDSFIHEDTQRKRRVVNDLQYLAGFVPITNIELDWRDAAWMWRRLLVALGWAHRAGVVHGAVFEEHVLIHPAGHGVALVDWCYSSPRPQAVIHGKHYPPEVARDREITPATDIYLATALMKRLVGTRMPTPLKRFADGCMFDAPRMRPQDAWRLLQELDEILGPRKFRPFMR